MVVAGRFHRRRQRRGVSWHGDETSLLDDFPAWTLGGRPIPHIDSNDSRQALVDLIEDNGGTTNIIDMSAWFRDAYDAAPNKEEAEIPVENTNGGILMITGKDDKLWPANKLAKIAMNRLEDSEDFEHRFTHLNYRNAGHVVLVPNLPTSYDHYLQPAPYNTYIGIGGTPEGTHRANHKAWKATLEFLEETLGD
ncbi:acyl-CoA thioester hydrolase/BAAT C-terminal domain-containing protein [Streptosporangium sp. OZ121]|uniref:acyl-CoA thioester hydrolase/BAAT C-terminal domain-containing protein n=1 Tax=Streptosporangium sp. OZ121 TaxID=3444183 RepID=UPI003F7A8E72